MLIGLDVDVGARTMPPTCVHMKIIIGQCKRFIASKILFFSQEKKCFHPSVFML